MPNNGYAQALLVTASVATCLTSLSWRVADSLRSFCDGIAPLV